MIQFSHLALREESLSQSTRDKYFRKTAELWSSERHPESVTKSRGPFDRGPAMLGTSGPGIATSYKEKCIILFSREADQLVEAECSTRCQHPISPTN